MDIYFPDPADYHYITQQKTENRREDRHNRRRVDCLSIDRYRLRRGEPGEGTSRIICTADKLFGTDNRRRKMTDIQE